MAQNKEISQALLEVFTKEIRDRPFLGIDQLKVLVLTLENAPTEALDRDNLVQILKIVMAKINIVHHQTGDTTKLYNLLQLLGNLLDAMSDAQCYRLGQGQIA